MVDHLVHAVGVVPSPQLGQRDKLTAASFDMDFRQVGRTGPSVYGRRSSIRSGLRSVSLRTTPTVLPSSAA